MSLNLHILKFNLFKPGYKPLWILLGVAVVLLLVGERVFFNLREAVKTNQKEQISAIGKLKANQIHDWLDDRHSDIRTMSEDSYFARDVDKWLLSGRTDREQSERIKNRLEAFIDAHHYHAIYLYDAQGQLAMSGGKSNRYREEMSDIARRVMLSGQVLFVDLHKNNDPQLPVSLGFMSPIKLKQLSVGAIYFAENPDSYLYPLIENRLLSSTTAETQLIRAEGEHVRFLTRLRNSNSAPLAFSLPLSTPDLAAAQALKGKHGLLEHAHDYQNVGVLSFATPIQGTPWVLISKVAEAEAYALVNRIVWVAGMVSIIIFLIGSAWFWQWWRREQTLQLSSVLEQKLRADEALLKIESQYHNLFDNAAVPILEEDYSRVKAGFRALSAQGVTDFREYFETHPEEVKKYSAMIQIVAINKPGLDFLGVSDKDKLVNYLPQFFVEESWPQFTRELVALAEGAMYFEYEVAMRNGAGECRDLLHKLSVAAPSSETLDRVLISFIDITERKQSELRVNFLAYHDRLTALPNRALFFDRLSQAMSQARRGGKHVALVFLDLDGFKPINDIHGHEAGDAVLKIVAQRLLSCVRAVDTVARLGGDEFAIIVGEMENPTEIERVTEQILQAFTPLIMLPNGQQCVVGVSMGISLYPDNGNEMDSLLAAADAAMYDSKHSGKNTYTYFGGTPHDIRDGDSWIVFDDAHLVGIAEIDDQHQELVRMVNRLNGVIKNREGDAVALLLYDELLEYTAFHFAAEHRLMEKFGFPDLPKHDLEHTHLVNEAVHFKARLTRGGDLLALQSIKDWLLNHIQYSDKPMAQYLRSKGLR